MSGNSGYNKQPSLFGFPSSLTGQQTPSKASIDDGTAARQNSASASLKPGNSTGRSMFGSIFNSDSYSPRTQPNASTGTAYEKNSISAIGGTGGRDNLRSLIITFNHAHKTDDEKLRHIAGLLEKILSSLKHMSLVESQLDVASTLAIIMKAVNINTPKEGTVDISGQQFDDLCLCMEVLSIFATANSDHIWSILNAAKVVPCVVNLYRICSLIDSARLKTGATSLSSAPPSDSSSKEDKFQAKWDHLSDLLMNTLKSSLKKENPTNNTIIFNTLFDTVLKPITVLETACSCWKRNAIHALESHIKSKKFTAENLDEIHKNDQFESLIEAFDQASEMKSKDLACVYLELIMAILVTAQKRNDWFIDNFDENEGYAAILSLLKGCNDKPSQSRIFDCLLQLSAIGKENLADTIVEIDRDSPFQTPGFMMPPANPEFQFRNLKVLTLYSEIYFEKHSAGDQNTNLTESLKVSVAEQILQITQLNPINYFIISGNSSVICRMVEEIDSVAPQMQQIILAIIKHVVIVLGYVPYKELSLLFSHFSGFSQEETTHLVSKTLLIFLESSSEWRETLRELGLINTLSSLILFIEKESSGVPTPSSWEAGKFSLSPAIVNNFELIMSILDELLKSEQSLLTFREKANSSLFNLLQYREYSKGVLLVIRNIIFKISLSDSQDHQVELIMLIENLETSNDHSVLLLLTSLLKDLLNDSSEIQNYFRKLGGYDRLFKLLSLKVEEKMQEEFLLNWFITLSNSFLNNADNRSYIQLNLAKFETESRLLEQCTNENAVSIVIHCLIGMAFKNDEIYRKYSQGKSVFNEPLGNICDTTFYDIFLALIKNLQAQNKYPSMVLQSLQYTKSLIEKSSNNRILLSNCDSLKHIIMMIDNLQKPVSLEHQHQSLTEDLMTETLSVLARDVSYLGMSSEELRLCLSLILEKRPCKGFLQDLILHAINHGNIPAYFQIEPNHENALGRLVINDYGRPAPPQTGYTFLAWIYISKFDKKHDIPIFTMVDNFGHERLCIFISKETRNIYVRTTKSLVKLGTYVVPEKQWTHLGIVHQKPMLTASYVYFYVNGVSICTEKCSYMGQPGSLASVKTFIGSFSHMPTKEAQYSLKIGPIYFVGEHLMDAQTISIIHDIGFEYTGNWQGSWAAYLVGNQKLQKQASKIIDEELNSPIFNQLATFAMSPSKVNQTHHLDIPEDNFWLSICAQNHIENISQLAKEEMKYSSIIDSSNNNIVFNGGHAKADCTTCKYATIEGAIISVCPKRIIEGVWTLGGCAILLRLVEDSESTEDLHKNLSILAGCVNNSWRNLADMERGQLYEILSFILKSKKQILTIASLDVLLSLVGKSIDTSNNSIICNPSAVRHLVLDIELWRSTIDIQKYYLNQITDLVVHSSYRDENIHTLNKMAIIKRFIMMLENQIIDCSIIPEFLQLLKIVLKAAWSGDVIKFVSTCVMNTLPKDASFSDQENVNEYGLLIRNAMLMMIIEIIEERENNIAYGADLVHAVSVKWILLFLSPKLSKKTVSLGARLFYSVFESIEYPGNRFKEAFTILPKLLKSHYEVLDIYLPVLAVIFGASIDGNSWTLPYEVPTLMALLKPKQLTAPVNVFRKRAFCPDMFSSLLSLLNSTVSVIAKERGETIDSKEAQLLEKCSSITQTTVGFLASMYLQVQPLREVLSLPETMEEILTILLSLISTEAVLSIDDYIEKIKSEPLQVGHVLSSKDSKELLISLLEVEDFSKQTGESKFIYEQNKSKGSRYRLHSKMSYLQNQEGVVRQNIEILIELVLIAFVENMLDPTKSPAHIETLFFSFPSCSDITLNRYQEIIFLMVLDALSQKINRRKIYIQDSKIMANILKFTSSIMDLIEQGKNDRIEDVTDFLIMLTKYAWDLEETIVKNGGKISHEFTQLVKQLNRAILYRAKYLQKKPNLSNQHTLDFLSQISIYQYLIVNISLNNDSDFLKCLMFHLSLYLDHADEGIPIATVEIWKRIVLQKPVHLYSILKNTQGDYQELVDGFAKLLEGNANSFISWFKSKHQELTKIFGEVTGRAWDDFVAIEAKHVKEVHSSVRIQTLNRVKRKKKFKDSESSTFNKYSDKTKLWITEIQSNFIIQRQKFKVDYKLMQSSLELEWKNLLAQLGQEHAILAVEDRKQRWKLDFTEGKARMRRKFRRNEKTYIEYQSKAEKILENLSPVQLPTESIIESWKVKSEKRQSRLLDSPNETKGEIIKETGDAEEVLEGTSSDEVDEKKIELQDIRSENQPDAEDADWEEVKMEENQNMKIQRLLQPGDSILDIVNCARLVGLELIEGIAMICLNNIYIVDKYFQKSDGEVQDLADVALEDRNIYHLIVTEPNRKVGEEPKKPENEKHTVRLCAYADIKEVHKRLYLFRHVAIEMFLSDGRNFFLAFWNQKSRDAVYNRLLSKSQGSASESIAGISNQSGPSALQTAIFGGSPLSELTHKWQNRDISNLAYLMHLNTLAGRSYNDLTQYPTFPWVLSNYESDEIDLENPSNYRDLSLPMGGQGESRASIFAERYDAWDDPSIPAYHYGTHYSSSMIVCSFLIRMEPFTEQYLKLQGGHFDHPDRLFHSIPQSWASASRLNTTDVRELIPEFYYLPDFLLNKNDFNFGTKQTGEKINHVVLPTWAKNDHRLFIKIHREALESEWVSANIQNWIDLTFGYKQQGEEAAKALNAFHHLSYEGAVDIDKIEDPVEKQSTISIIHNFGQTPKQLFKKPHPKRNPPSPESTYKINKSYSQLIQSAVYLKDLGGSAASDIALNSVGQLCVVGPKKVFLPGNPARYLEWGHFDHSLRIFQTDNQRRLSVFESLHIGQISHAVFADHETLITGGNDKTICVWSFTNGKKAVIDLRACMRGHRDKITHIAVSRAFSIIVSGSEDCSAIIWDLNRHQYTRSLIGHQNAIKDISINNNNGDILTSDEHECKLWDINGDLLCQLSFAINDPAHCSIIYEGKSSEVFDSDLIFTGHKSGVVRIWKKLFDTESKTNWSLKLAKTLTPNLTENPIELIWFPPSARFIVTSDSKGRIQSWMLPDSGTEIHYTTGDACLSCASKLAVIGRKANCRSCGGLYCSNCVSSTSNGFSRCAVCSKKIEVASQNAPLSKSSDFWTLV